MSMECGVYSICPGQVGTIHTYTIGQKLIHRVGTYDVYALRFHLYSHLYSHHICIIRTCTLLLTWE